MFANIDDGRGAVRQLAWMIWQAKLKIGVDSTPEENWFLAEALLGLPEWNPLFFRE